LASDSKPTRELCTTFVPDGSHITTKAKFSFMLISFIPGLTSNFGSKTILSGESFTSLIAFESLTLSLEFISKKDSKGTSPSPITKLPLRLLYYLREIESSPSPLGPNAFSERLSIFVELLLFASLLLSCFFISL